MKFVPLLQLYVVILMVIVFFATFYNSQPREKQRFFLT